MRREREYTAAPAATMFVIPTCTFPPSAQKIFITGITPGEPIDKIGERLKQQKLPTFFLREP
jgi:hypothetical protein